MIKFKSNHMSPHTCAVMVSSAVLFPFLLLSPVLALLAGWLLRLRLRRRLNGWKWTPTLDMPMECIVQVHAGPQSQITASFTLRRDLLLSNDDRLLQVYRTIQSNWMQPIWAIMHHTFSMHPSEFWELPVILPKTNSHRFFRSATVISTN